MGLTSIFIGLFLVSGTLSQSSYRAGGGSSGSQSGNQGGLGGFGSQRVSGGQGGFGGQGGSGSQGGFKGLGGSGGFGEGNDDGGFGSDGASGSLEDAIPGVPGDDYPIFSELPESSFVCDGQADGGYYADAEADCQAFHICSNDGNGGLTKYSFLCPNGSIFNQQYFVCDWWFNVDCSLAEELYSLNDEYAAEREANSPDGGSYQEGQQGGRGTGGGAGGRGGSGSQGLRGGQGGSRQGVTRGQGGSVNQGVRGSQGGSRQGAGASGYQGVTHGNNVSGSRGSSRGATTSGRRGTPAISASGSVNSYLAPGDGAGFVGSQSGFFDGQQEGLGGGFVGGVKATDTGYGAPGSFGGGFDNEGGFPQYARNSRDLNLEENIKIIKESV